MSLSQPSRVIVVEPVQAATTAQGSAEAPEREPSPRVEPPAAPHHPEAQTAAGS